MTVRRHQVGYHFSSAYTKIVNGKFHRDSGADMVWDGMIIRNRILFCKSEQICNKYSTILISSNR